METYNTMYTTEDDSPVFRRVFKLYEQGLDNTTKSYFQAFRRLREQISKTDAKIHGFTFHIFNNPLMLISR